MVRRRHFYEPSFAISRTTWSGLTCYHLINLIWSLSKQLPNYRWANMEQCLHSFIQVVTRIFTLLKALFCSPPTLAGNIQLFKWPTVCCGWIQLNQNREVNQDNNPKDSETLPRAEGNSLCHYRRPLSQYTRSFDPLLIQEYWLVRL